MADSDRDLPENNTLYATKDYWESRYQEDSANNVQQYEWLKGWSFYKEALTPLIDKSHNILHLGCGNSALSPEMYKDGYLSQENIDFSEIVISDMKKLYADMTGIKWTVADIFHMSETLELKSFDCVLDKGTLDAFLTGMPDEDPWDPSPECLKKCTVYLTQVEAVMKPGGVFIQITWSQPHFRRRLLEVTGMDVSVKKVGTDWEFFVFVCRRKE
ncbi:hypothetical protein HDU76_000119 [Blyttiomyces sp. JEL0837]|nr:hypothetical protein HDU76_000119 [Blyttiomyces sp. JEL0837]